MNALTKQKWLYWLVALAGVVWCLIDATGNGDFFIFLSAAGDLDHHTDIYAKVYLDGYHYYYSVFFALVLRLFYQLPFYWVKFAWLLLNLGLFVGMFNLLRQTQPVAELPDPKKRWFLLLVLLFSLRFLRDNIHTSQITILIMACCVYGLYYIQRGWLLRGAALLALGINIKLLPVVLLPWLLYRGHFKALLWIVAIYAGLMLFPALVIGVDYNQALLSSWWHLVNPTNKQHVLDTAERSFHSLSTLLSTLLVAHVPDQFALPLKRNVADVSLNTLAYLLTGVRMVLVLFTFYFLRGRPFRPAGSSGIAYAEVSYILLLIPLIFPHQQHYAFLFSVPAFALVLLQLIAYSESIGKATRSAVIALLALVYLCANLKILIGEFNPYYEHFKILTYGTLILIPLLAWASGVQRRSMALRGK